MCLYALKSSPASLPVRPLVWVATSGGDIEWHLTGSGLMGAPFHPLRNSDALFRLKQPQHTHDRGFNLSLMTTNMDRSFWDKNYLFQHFPRFLFVWPTYLQCFFTDSPINTTLHIMYNIQHFIFPLNPLPLTPLTHTTKKHIFLHFHGQ